MGCDVDVGFHHHRRVDHTLCFTDPARHQKIDNDSRRARDCLVACPVGQQPMDGTANREMNHAWVRFGSGRP